MRILLAEDYVAIGELIWKTLDEAGNDVTFVVTGAAAINMLDNERFDLVVTDWELEWMGPNGADILKHAQEVSPTTVVCIFSSIDRNYDLRKLGLEADKVLTKDDIHGLLEFVKEVEGQVEE